MEVDVDWIVIGSCFVGSCIIGLLQRSSTQLLRHLQNAQPISSLEKLENSQLIAVDLGTVENKSNSGIKSSNNLNLVALSRIHKEHKVVFNPALRLWIDSPNVFSTHFSSVPFNLKTYAAKNKNVKFVINCQDESVFSKVLSTVYSYVDSSENKSVTANVMDYLSGEKTKAFETIEKGLVIGSRVTAVGYINKTKSAGILASAEWEIDGDPSGRGYKLILSTSSFAELIAKENSKNTIYKTMMFLVSGVLLVFVGKLVYRFGKDQIAKYRFNQTLEQLRAEVRNQRHDIQNVQNGNAAGVNNDEARGDENTCVICLANERRTFFVPCGHVCACNTCAEMLMGGPHQNRRCPICRQIFTAVNILRYP
ncbi:mitochondrial ubiquitin ligase activator of nfkb 1-A-like [Convolutriloba macropyga]|uniref:mitochondrial ubiquitin ligase activator of nfkb 1-A-like n=1 Tax=Convolutriloba macropyga TaxID=536237 RepID=UPI003F527C87